MRRATTTSTAALDHARAAAQHEVRIRHLEATLALEQHRREEAERKYAKLKRCYVHLERAYGELQDAHGVTMRTLLRPFGVVGGWAHGSVVVVVIRLHEWLDHGRTRPYRARRAAPTRQRHRQLAHHSERI